MRKIVINANEYFMILQCKIIIIKLKISGKEIVNQ